LVDPVGSDFDLQSATLIIAIHSNLHAIEAPTLKENRSQQVMRFDTARIATALICHTQAAYFPKRSRGTSDPFLGG
jgi:hypothetical protein